MTRKKQPPKLWIKYCPIILEEKYWIILFLFISVSFLFGTDLGFFDSFRIPLGSLFTGILALTGFTFTARTFITFKLNEVVYSNRDYRERHEKYLKDGAINRSLYHPLKTLDTIIGRTNYVSMFSLVLILIVGIFSDYSKVSLPVNFSPKYLQDVIFSAAGWQLLWKHDLICPVIVYKILSSVTLAVLAINALKLGQCILSINHNIKSIINIWEKAYNEECAPQSKETNTPETDD